MEDGATVSESLSPHAAYERLRAAQLADVQAALVEHVARLNWSRDQIDRYRTHRLRALLGYALERSPFHARRLHGLDPNRATVADLSSLPIMTKQDAQAQWDSLITARYLTHERAERILAEQQWFSYTPEDQMVFSSGGSSGVRGIYVWDWQLYVSTACLAWRMQAREEQREWKRSS
jgi:phenylacetate-CoA ligase